MTDWTVVLRAVAPSAKSSVLAQIAPYLDSEFSSGEINTPLRQAHFIAQMAHESAGFSTLQEIGGPSYFRRYDGRRDLGNIYPGDGAKFHGRCPFQLTGRGHYREYGKRLGVDLIKNPDAAVRGPIDVKICIIFWNDRNLSDLADDDDVRAITRKINGGYNGLASRKAYLARAKAALRKHAPAAVGLLDAPSPDAAPADTDGAPDEPAPREKVKAIQERLKAIGYHMVGTPDGQAGASTVAATAAFQHDNDLPVTGEVDDDTERALWTAGDRPIPEDRANGTPDGSRIAAGAKNLIGGSAAMGAAGAASLASDALDKAEAAKGMFDRVSALTEPLSAMTGFLHDHIAVGVIGVAIAIALVAWHVLRARTEDYRTGKTP